MTVQVDKGTSWCGYCYRGSGVDYPPLAQSGLWDVKPSLQAPLTTAFEKGSLGPENGIIADYGRILRFAQFGESVRIGPVEHRSLGFQTVMRRYYNGLILITIG